MDGVEAVRVGENGRSRQRRGGETERERDKGEG